MFFELSVHDGQAPVRQAMLSGDSSCLRVEPYPVWQHTGTFVSPSAFSRRAVVSYWRKYVHEVLINHLGGLSLPRKSVVRLTDRPDMTLDVYRGRKTTIQFLRVEPYETGAASYFHLRVMSLGNVSRN